MKPFTCSVAAIALSYLNFVSLAAFALVVPRAAAPAQAPALLPARDHRRPHVEVRHNHQQRAAVSEEPPVVVVVVTTVVTVTDVLAPETAAATTESAESAESATTSFGPAPTSCDLRYCGADGTSYCAYWGGYTSYDVTQRRPVPGETRTAFALCGGGGGSSTAKNVAMVSGGGDIRS